MFDLKEQMLKAGLVTENQVQKVEEQQKQSKHKHKGPRKNERSGPPNKSSGQKRKKAPPAKGRKPRARAPQKEQSFEDIERRQWQKRLFRLKKSPKKEIYEVTRNWVERNRLDPVKGLPGESASRFYFTRADGSIASLMLEPEITQALSKGEAGIVTFMSHHGVNHAVVTKDLALDMGFIVPLWLRFLDGDERAGRVARAVTKRQSRREKTNKRGLAYHGRLCTLIGSKYGEYGPMTLVRPGRAGQGDPLGPRRHHAKIRRWLLCHPTFKYFTEATLALRSLTHQWRQ
jgi:uncharacterized protein YaiL (DUF2058 family)